ncbi:MAG: sensor histidine kinase [Alistipes finegoldii]
MKQHLPVDAPCSDYVRLIEKNVGRIQRMISQLLQFREIESQKMHPEPAAGRSDPVHRQHFLVVRVLRQQKGYRNRISVPVTRVSTPSFDHDVIEKIFTNLFSNAIKYTSENGYVGVKIGRRPAERWPEGAVPAADTEYLSFTVTNTGAEIPEDKKDIIFESFNRLSARRPEFESSTGLGLAIVRELVGNLAGSITLHSGNSKVASRWCFPSRRVPKRPAVPPSRTTTRFRDRQPAERVRCG